MRRTTTVRVTPYSQATFKTNRYSLPVDRACKTVTLKAYPFTIEIWDGAELLASHPRCYEREQDVFDPHHYLPLLLNKPGAFDFAKPIKQWKADWPETYAPVAPDLTRDLARWSRGSGICACVDVAGKWPTM
jgi:hypothetical protein